MRWKCFIPGKRNTDWEGGYFPLTMEFSEEYPAKPPKVGLVFSLCACVCMSAIILWQGGAHINAQQRRRACTSALGMRH